MSGGIDLTGMVLASYPAGEYDRRVILLTAERGRITAFARGARRQNSALLAATVPFSFGVFRLYEGRNAYTLAGAEITRYFETLKKDLETVYYGSYFLELAGFYARENLDASGMLNLLYVSLRALEKPALPNRLVRYIYEVRLMAGEGEFPLDMAQSECRSSTAAYALRFICTAPLEKLYTFVLTDEALDDLARVQDRIRKRLIDTDLKSLPVLESLCGGKA